MMKTVRVVIVDDEKPFAEGIADSLHEEPDIEVVGVAFDGLLGLGIVTNSLPDAVLMDLNMPIMGGVEAIRRIKQQSPSVEILVLTVFDDDTHLFEALQAGAKGYLLKNAQPEEVVQAIRDVVQGNAVIPPALAARVLAEFQRVASQGPELCRLFSLLTHQESEVLKLIGQHKTNAQICTALFLEMPTVKKHVGNILRKLEVNDRTEAALIAQRSGLLPGSTGAKMAHEQNKRN